MLGVGQIVEISDEEGIKVRKLCPVCGSGHIKPRKSMRPVFACQKKRKRGEPQHVFDQPVIQEVMRTQLKAWFGDSFKPFPDAIPIDDEHAVSMPVRLEPPRGHSHVVE